MYTQTFVVVLISCAFAGAQWTPDPFCPYPSYEVTRYPYYGDCSLYWECFEGTKYVMECPEGLEFNAPLQQCDTPSIANCDPLASTTANPNPPTFSVGPTSSDGPGPDCPNSEEITYYPYDGDCTMYWECYAGNHYLYNCPDGLWWHQAISECDYPGDFCGASTLTDGTGSTDIPTTKGTPDPLCPLPGDEVTYYPYPGDCTKYWECFAGDKYEMTCPDDLWWHEEISECDYPGDFCTNEI
ncbi:probable chitinase 10 [Zophobas morio]|uniref:probable chitinase 10 n=1 Tax=Zophobas morio TaxID=2755281 RepID=UPI003083D300